MSRTWGETSSSVTNMDSAVEFTSVCMSTTGVSNGGAREKDWSKSLWLFGDQWTRQMHDMRRLNHVLHSIHAMTNATSLLHELSRKSIVKLNKVRAFLERKSVKLSEGNLVMEVLMRGVSLSTYKGLLRSVVKNLSELLEHSSTQMSTPNKGDPEPARPNKNTSTPPKLNCSGLEKQLMLLIIYKQLIDQHLKDPWGVSDMTPMRTVIVFEMIRMDLTTRLHTLLWYYQQQQEHNKDKTVSPLYSLAQTILSRLPPLELFKWVELDYFVAKTVLLLSQFTLEAKNQNFQDSEFTFSPDVVLEWLSYVKSLRHLLEPLCEKEMRSNQMERQQQLKH